MAQHPHKTKLSVNVNKVATLRNARGKNIPNLLAVTKMILRFPVGGVTVHPRPDGRHIKTQDVFDLKALLDGFPGKEYNIEGRPEPEFLSLMEKIRPHQCTLVPDPPQVLTSNAGWDFVKYGNWLKEAVKKLSDLSIRCSLFLDPLCMSDRQYEALNAIRPDRIELYTEHYAESHIRREHKRLLPLYGACARRLKACGIGINAGHDLNHSNLLDFLRAVPQTSEVSIGQALIASALEEGLPRVLQRYLNLIDRAFSKTGNL